MLTVVNMTILVVLKFSTQILCHDLRRFFKEKTRKVVLRELGGFFQLPNFGVESSPDWLMIKFKASYDGGFIATNSHNSC